MSIENPDNNNFSEGVDPLWDEFDMGNLGTIESNTVPEAFPTDDAAWQQLEALCTQDLSDQLVTLGITEEYVERLSSRGIGISGIYDSSDGKYIRRKPIIFIYDGSMAAKFYEKVMNNPRVHPEEKSRLWVEFYNSAFEMVDPNEFRIKWRKIIR